METMQDQASRPNSRGRKPRPEWLDRMIEAKRSVFNSLSPADQAEARAIIEEKRAAAKARKIASAERLKRIAELSLSGHTLREIALSEDRKPSAVYQFAASRGFSIPLSETTVRRVASITIDAEEALRSAAYDYGSTAGFTLTELITFALADDAAILRRVLHIRRKDAKAA